MMMMNTGGGLASQNTRIYYPGVVGDGHVSTSFFFTLSLAKL